MYGGMKVKAIEEKLNEIGFKPENNYVYTIKKASFLNRMLLGSLSNLSNQYIMAVNEKNIVLIKLTKMGDFSNEVPQILDRREYLFTCKNGIFSSKFEITSNISEEKIILKSQKLVIGFSWHRKNLKNMKNY